MTPDQIKQVVDAVFAELLVVTGTRPLLHFAVVAVQAIVDGILPAVVGRVNAPK